MLKTLLCMAVAATSSMHQPHLLFVLVDDLGHANVGFHWRGGVPPPAEVATPHIDGLADSGMVLNRHYVFRMCTPSRTSFLSGRFPVHVTESLRDPSEPNAGMPRNMTGIGLVLKQAGYATFQVGKWDAGMATVTHTPRGRGFDSSLGYFEHKNDFWTKGIMQSKCLDAGGVGAYANLTDLWDTDQPAASEMFDESVYEEGLFRDRALSILRAHDPRIPLFLLYTPHVAHVPLQAPSTYIERFAHLTRADDEGVCRAQTRRSFCALCRGPTPAWPAARPLPCRALYAAMVSFLDDALGELIATLRARSMYEHSLVVLSSDNGGPVDLEESAANNYPLRGGKYSDFEGGVRATALVAGGVLPRALRGTTSDAVMHIADWVRAARASHL